MVKLLIFNGPPGSGAHKLAQLTHRRLGEATLGHMRLDAPLRNHVVEILGISADYLLDGILDKPQELLNKKTPRTVMLNYLNKHLWPMFGVPVLANWLVKAIWLNDYHKEFELILIPDLQFECELSALIDFIKIAGGDPETDIQLIHLERKGYRWLTGIDSGHEVFGDGHVREITACTDSLPGAGMNHFTEIETILFDLLKEWLGKKNL